MKNALSEEEKTKRNQLLTDVSDRMIVLMQDFDTEWNKDNFPWDEDLRNVFKNGKDMIDDYSRSLHDYFGVEPIYSETETVFPMFEELNTFNTLKEIYAYMTYLVLKKHNLLMEDEKLD